MRLAVVISVFGFIFTSVSYAQKSRESDQEKALERLVHCEQLKKWNVVDYTEVDCGEDNHHFLSTKTARQYKEDIRIGSFNLLHPGMEKTKFKDFSLIANIINSEFDLLAAIELVNPMGEEKEFNALISGQIDDKFNEYSLLKEKYDEQKLVVENIRKEKLKVSSQMNKINNEIYHLDKLINDSSKKLRKAERDSKKLAKRGFSIFGWEPFKKRRLKKLKKAKADVITYKNKILEHNKDKADFLSAVETLEDKIGIQDQELAGENQKLNEIDVNFKTANTQFQNNLKSFNLPGYITLLIELKKLDPSWSLILTPFGDSLEESHVKELSGYFYRNGIVKTVKNNHCTKFYDDSSVGCYPSFYASFLNEDRSNVLARRPFLTSFETVEGNKEINLLAAHIRFNSPKDENVRKEMMSSVFAVDDYKDLGTGVTKANYARHAEMKVTMELIDQLEANGMENIIYMGDLNLESKNKFFANSLGDKELVIDSPTSVTFKRFKSDKETKGLASNYDHFIMDRSLYVRCRNFGSIDFINGSYASQINEKYLIRNIKDQGPYEYVNGGQMKMNHRLGEFSHYLTSETLQNPDYTNSDLEEDLGNYKERVFLSQLEDKNYYKYFQQVISDHLPIKMHCNL